MKKLNMKNTMKVSRGKEGPILDFSHAEDEDVVRVAQVAVPRQARRDSSDPTQEVRPADLVERALEVQGWETSIGLRRRNGTTATVGCGGRWPRNRCMSLVTATKALGEASLSFSHCCWVVFATFLLQCLHLRTGEVEGLSPVRPCTLR